MITAELVQTVSRTGVASTIQTWSLNISQVMKRTVSSDWEPGYVQLTAAGARKVADKLNKERPWDSGARIRSVAAALPSRVIEGKVVETTAA